MRLTQAKRHDIVDQETNNKFYDLFSENEKKLNQELNKLAEKTVPKWITDEMLSSRYIKTSMDWDLEGYTYRDFRTVNLNLSKPYPVQGYSVNVQPSKTFDSLMKKRIELESKKQSFQGDLRTVLFSYNSVKKLIEAMPELKEYFKDEVTSNALVPVEQIEKVRKSLVKRKKD